jgi:parallel beta-helix repeat protein
MPADGGITLTGSNVRQNKVHGNIVIGNNGDGISVRDDASLNQIEKNSANYNTSTDAQGGYLANGDPAAPFFWDIAFRNAPSNTVKPDNRCLTQSPSVTPANVCGPDENATWFDGKH